MQAVTFDSLPLRLLDSMADSHELNASNGGNGGGGLFPQLFNVAIRASIRANATCGQNGREEYCKLVDAYPHKKWATQCGICNSHSSDMAKHRPIESVISNTQSDDRWWQSPTLQNGHNYEYITITLDLKQAKPLSSSLLVVFNKCNRPVKTETNRIELSWTFKDVKQPSLRGQPTTTKNEISYVVCHKLTMRTLADSMEAAIPNVSFVE
ncbi:hypothetical protein GQX74_001420 [Glossina fuscipes]|nr:hypothetical protein GQX74_001420 [Glossina fuscipes]